MKIIGDFRQVHELENKLIRIGGRGIPFAEVETVNRAAFETQALARDQLGSRMTLRNRWTERSVQVDRATLSHRESVVGSTLDYLRTQELGGREDATGKHGVAIPTSSAAGQARGTKPRTRLVRPRNRVRNITLTKVSKSKSRQQRNVIAVKEAARTKKRYVFLDTGRRKGLYKVTGGKRRPKVELMHDLSHKSVAIPRNPWLMPPADTVRARMPQYYAAALSRQLSRIR